MMAVRSIQSSKLSLIYEWPFSGSWWTFGWDVSKRLNTTKSGRSHVDKIEFLTGSNLILPWFRGHLKKAR
jgi:hypothetical protein